MYETLGSYNDIKKRYRADVSADSITEVGNFYFDNFKAINISVFLRFIICILSICKSK